jgi:hypothetical protein
MPCKPGSLDSKGLPKKSRLGVGKRRGRRPTQLAAPEEPSIRNCEVCLTSLATSTVADFIRACDYCAAKIEKGIKDHRER